MLTDSTNARIIKDLASASNNLTDADVFDIVDFQFKFTKEMIEAGRFVELPKFGRFKVKESRDKYAKPEARFYENRVKAMMENTSKED